MAQFPIVEVVWVDPTTYDYWMSLEDVEETCVVTEVRMVGYLIKESEQWVHVALMYREREHCALHGTEMRVATVHVLPRACVISMEVLRDAE